MEHLALIDPLADEHRNGKSLRDRASGRFYTHELIGRHLCQEVARIYRPPCANALRLIDPFCGDGRLVCWLLEQVRNRVPENLSIDLWDCDPEAVPEAKARVEAVARSLGLKANVQAVVRDTFRSHDALTPEYDVVVTNPPWELLKPDHRELTTLRPEDAATFTRRLRELDAELAVHFPHSQPSRKFAGWGTNLARVGAEVALRLMAPDGVCGVVSPSSLFADTTSTRLREYLFETVTVADIAHFPAEANLFEAVDVPCVTFSAARRYSPRIRPTLSRYSAERRLADRSQVTLSRSWLKGRSYSLPITLGAEGIEVLESFDHLPQLAEMEGKHPTGLWAGRELDETRREEFLLGSGEHRFVKGKDIHRFRIVREPIEFIDPARRAIPRSASHVRLAWRDVSRPSQRRRVHATLLPKGWVTGNSLGVAHFRDGNLPRLMALLAVVSSVPFEYQVRSLLSTGHVSLAVIRQVRIPPLTDEVVPELAAAALACLQGDPDAENELNLATSAAYALDPDTHERLVESFSPSSARMRRPKRDFTGAH